METENRRQRPQRACRKKKENETETEPVPRKLKKSTKAVETSPSPNPRNNVSKVVKSTVAVVTSLRSRSPSAPALVSYTTPLKSDGNSRAVLKKFTPRPPVPIKKGTTAMEMDAAGQGQTSRLIALRDKKSFIGRLERIQDRSDKPLTSTPLLLPSKIFSQRDVESCFGFDNDSNGSGSSSSPSSNADSSQGRQSQQISTINQTPNLSPVVLRSPLKSAATTANTTTPFSNLLVRYGMLKEKNDEKIVLDQIRVLGGNGNENGSKKIPKTYFNRKAVKFPTEEMEAENEDDAKKSGKSKPKRRRSSNKPKSRSKAKTQTQQTRQKPKEKMSKEAEEWMNQKNREFEGIMDFPLCVEKK